MKTLALTAVLVAIALLPSVEFAQDKPSDSMPAQAVTNEQLEELWKTGSLWQVGDNIKKVDEARKAIIAAGDAGLAFSLTKLNQSDGLQYRCLEAVFAGFGAKAINGLLERANDKDLFVRRNVAAMLGVINDPKAAPGMLEHFKREEDIRVKVPILQALAKWKIPEALDPLIETTKSDNERARMRLVPLLGNYEGDLGWKAAQRLAELLDDAAFFVRDAAAAGLLQMGQGNGWRDAFQTIRRRISETAHLKEPNFEVLRRCVSVMAQLAPPRETDFFDSLGFSGWRDFNDPKVVADLARAMPFFWKTLDKKFDARFAGTRKDARDKLDRDIVSMELRLETEKDPFALDALERSLKELEEIRHKWPRE